MRLGGATAPLVCDFVCFHELFGRCDPGVSRLYLLFFRGLLSHAHVAARGRDLLQDSEVAGAEVLARSGTLDELGRAGAWPRSLLPVLHLT